MIKVTKYTQGHLYPTASFTYVERHGGVGEEKGRMEGKDEGRKMKDRSKDIDWRGI